MISLVTSFLLVLEKHGFPQDFLKWIAILLKNQKSRGINEGRITHYFLLEKCKWLGDATSGYLSILVLEIAFRFY